MTECYVAITDASPEIGTGHVMRQISLAQAAIKSDLAPMLVSHSPWVAKMCKLNGIPFIFARSSEEIAEVIERTSAHHLVIDVYERDFTLFRLLCNQRKSILMVSEVGYGFPHFGDHVVRIGSNLHEWDCLEETLGPDRNTQIHSGRAWMIFRDEFNLCVDESKRDLETILICHGGSDPFGLTQRCLKAIELTHECYKCNILVTDFFSDINRIYALAQDSRHKCKVIVNTPSIGHWMRRSTVALINGGNVRYELCVTQTPFVAVSFQPQQYKCTEQVAALSAGINLGVMSEVRDKDIAYAVENLLIDNDRWRSMHDAMGTLFDLHGCDRIVDLLLE